MVREIIVGAILICLTALVTLLLTRKNRLTSKQDQSTAEIASDLKTLTAEKATNLRNEASAEARRLANQHDKLVIEVDVLGNQVAELLVRTGVIDAQIAPVNAAVVSMLANRLKHYHTPVVDNLLLKLLGNTLTPDEEKQLFAAMQTVEQAGDIPDDERDAAHQLPAWVKRMRREAALIAAGAKFSELRVVGILQEGED